MRADLNFIGTGKEEYTYRDKIKIWLIYARKIHRLERSDKMRPYNPESYGVQRVLAKKRGGSSIEVKKLPNGDCIIKEVHTYHYQSDEYVDEHKKEYERKRRKEVEDEL